MEVFAREAFVASQCCQHLFSGTQLQILSFLRLVGLELEVGARCNPPHEVETARPKVSVFKSLAHRYPPGLQ